jgi:putative FmdB family regulatory protein
VASGADVADAVGDGIPTGSGETGVITYLYRCPACGAETELRHSIREEPAVACACGAAMGRAVAGEGVALLTGRQRTAAMHAERRKEAEDTAHAERVAAWIRDEARPRAQASLAAALDRRAEQRARTGRNSDGL